MKTLSFTSMRCLSYRSINHISLLIVMVFVTCFAVLIQSQMLTKFDSVTNIILTTPRIEASTHQPYGKTISISFSTFDINFDFQDMKLDSTAIQNTAIDIHNNGQLKEGRMTQTTYRAEYLDKKGHNSYAIITINPETDEIIAFISEYNERYYIQHHLTVTQLMLVEQPQPTSNTIAYRSSDIKYFDMSGEAYGKCAFFHRDVKSNVESNVQDIISNPLNLDATIQNPENTKIDPTKIESSSSSSYMTYTPSFTPFSSNSQSELNTEFDECYKGYGIVGYILNINFIADVGFFNIFKTQALLESYLQNIAAVMNLIFNQQYQLSIHVSNVEVYQTLNSNKINKLGKTEPNSTCDQHTISEHTVEASEYTNYKAIVYPGRWFVFTNCYPSGFVSAVNDRRLCGISRFSVTSYTAGFRENILHTLGHVLSYKHTSDRIDGTKPSELGGCLNENSGCNLPSTDEDNPGGYGFHRLDRQDACSELNYHLENDSIFPGPSSNKACLSSKIPEKAEWVATGDWDYCDCETNTKSPKLKCYINGIHVYPAVCEHLPKPANEPCDTDSCVPYWKVFTTSRCLTSSPCITSTQEILRVTCMRSNKYISDYLCPQPKPVLQECTGPGFCYDWTITDWLSCTSTDPCIRGFRHRGVDCEGDDCRGEKPHNYESCFGEGICEADWVSTPWGTCSSTNPCLEGIKTRTVTCIATIGEEDRIPDTGVPDTGVPDILCSKITKPSSIEPCKATGICEANWSSSSWEECSSTDPCVEGTRKRAVECKSDDHILNDSSCEASEKPATSETCVGAGICSGIWDSTLWGTCSSIDPCIQGIRTRTVTCKRGDMVIDDQYCTATKPHYFMSCSYGGVCRGTWAVGEWEVCSSTDPCIQGTQTRKITCKSSAGDLDIANKYCKTTKPLQSKTCSGGGICKTDWSSTPWGTCSSTNPCLEGIKTRTVTCKHGNTIVGDHNCTTTKPASSESCTADGICTGRWNSTSWGRCSSIDPCIEGIKARTVICTTNTIGEDDPISNIRIPDKFCSETTKPSSIESCTAIGRCDGEWNSTTWSVCSSTDPCIKGTRIRAVTCQSKILGIDIDSKYCLSTSMVMPNSFESCQPGSNSSDDGSRCHGSWSYTTWSLCSATKLCTKGIQSRTVTCKNPLADIDIDDIYCEISSKPAMTQVCIGVGDGDEYGDKSEAGCKM